MKQQLIKRHAFSLSITAVLLAALVSPEAHAVYARWGMFRIDTRVGVTAGVDYTDNVYLSETDRRSDVSLIIGPVLSGTIGFDLPLLMAFPSGQRITLSTSAAYTTSLTKDGPNDAFGAPASASFDWPIYVDKWIIRLNDTFNFRNEPLESLFASNVNRINQYYNTATISVGRPFGRTSINASAQRYDQWMPDAYVDLQYTRYSFSLTPSVALNESFSVFWANSYFINEQNDPRLQDSTGYSSMLGVSGQITDSISGSVSAGWQHTDLEEIVYNGVTYPARSYDGLAVSGGLNYTHRLRPSTTHSLSFYASPGMAGVTRYSSLQDIYGVTYTISHRLSRHVVLSPHVSYVHTKSLASSGYTGEVFVPSPERADLLSVGIGLSRSFGRHLSGTILYRYQTRDSSFPGDDYDVNKVSLRLNYWF